MPPDIIEDGENMPVNTVSSPDEPAYSDVVEDSDGIPVDRVLVYKRLCFRACGLSMLDCKICYLVFAV